MKLSIRLATLACICVLSCGSGKGQQSDWRTSFIPIDPWRAVNGQTNYVKLNGVQFCGKVVEVTSDGIRIEGTWGRLGTIYYPVRGWPYPYQPEYPDYFVTNYPYLAFPGQIIPSAQRLMAWSAGAYTYKTVNGRLRTIARLDYGTPCGPNPVLLAAAKEQIQVAKEQKREAELRRMEWLERDATNGDVSAQYSLGFHYLHGIGCETNEVMGIFWLLKAAQQGDITASNDLQEFEFEATNTVGTLKR